MTAEEKSEEYVKTTYCETRSGCDVYRLHDCNEGVCIRCQEFENKKQDYLEGFSDGKQETNTVIAKKNKKLENDLHEAKEIIRKCLDMEQEKKEHLKTQSNHNGSMTNKRLYIPDGIFLESAAKALDGSTICLSFHVNAKDTDTGEFLEQIYDIIERDKVKHI